jgi:hypothetical protein
VRHGTGKANAESYCRRPVGLRSRDDEVGIQRNSEEVEVPVRVPHRVTCLTMPSGSGSCMRAEIQTASSPMTKRTSVSYWNGAPSTG